jgi:hypothetical protein
VIAVVAAIRAFTLRRQWTFFSDHLEFDERWLLRRREWTEPLDGYRGVAVKQQREEPDKQPLHVLTLVHAYTKRRNVVLSKTPDLAGFRKAQGRYARLLGVPGLIETGVGLEARAPDDVDRPVRERVATGTLADSFDPLGKPPGRRLSVAIEGDALLLRVRPGLGKGGIVVPVALFALWAMLDAITWAPGTSAAYRFAEFVPLTAGVLATIVLILLTDELRVSPRRIEKRWRMPWGWGIGGAIILAGGVTDVHVAKKGPGLWRSRTVQMVADADILHFGGALDHDAKVWVRDCIVAVISK